ncbi:MAG: sigma-70 family RNA polymerase sigma factor [Isosphaeraceae bacterium]
MPDPILPRIARGDQDAVRECIDRYGGLVWSLARRWFRDQHEVEDAVQEIFLDLWAHAGRFDGRVASEVTFVATLCRRRLIDRRRRRQSRPAAVALTDDLAGPDDQRSAVDLRDEAERVDRALSRLSPEEQRVLRLSFREGLTHEEIARQTGLPLGTVKTRARRGLIQVRKLMGISSQERARTALGQEVGHDC